jgi:hypothetical protein
MSAIRTGRVDCSVALNSPSFNDGCDQSSNPDMRQDQEETFQYSVQAITGIKQKLLAPVGTGLQSSSACPLSAMLCIMFRP